MFPMDSACPWRKGQGRTIWLKRKDLTRWLLTLFSGCILWSRRPGNGHFRTPGTAWRVAGHRPLLLVERSEDMGVSVPTSQPAALCFITYQFLPKRKPYKFNQLFIWKYLTFFPLELFDIIVLRVRITKNIKMCDSGGHRKHPFLARMQVSFPVDSSLERTGVSVNCLAQWRTYYMPITMKYKTRTIHLAQPSPIVKAGRYYRWESYDLRKAPVAHKFRECSVLASKPLRFLFAALPFEDVIKQPCSRTFNLWKPVMWNSLTYMPIKERCSLSVVVKCKTPLKRLPLFPSQGHMRWKRLPFKYNFKTFCEIKWSIDI